MYIVKNNVGEIIPWYFKNKDEVTNFIRGVAVHNGDEELSITSFGEAMDYINNSDRLELSQETYTVSLTFEGIESDNPLEAVKKIIGWINENQGNDLVYDVLCETINKKYTVDMSENEEDAVLPNND